MGNGRILIVDDDEALVKSLSGFLCDEGFKVSSTADGGEALTLMHTVAPAVVLLDIWLPGMDGIETLQMLKKMNAKIEVIVMSGHGNIETAVKVTKLGAVDYIEKPLSLDALLLAVGRALHRREPESIKRQQVSLLGQIHRLIGYSPQMQRIRHLVQTLSPFSGLQREVVVLTERITQLERQITQLDSAEPPKAPGP